MANCLLCKLREGCNGAYHTTGDCPLFQFGNTSGCAIAEGRNYINDMASCKTCKLRNQCKEQGKITGGNICCLSYQYDANWGENTGGNWKNIGTSYPKSFEPKVIVELYEYDKYYEGMSIGPNTFTPKLHKKGVIVGSLENYSILKETVEQLDGKLCDKAVIYTIDNEKDWFFYNSKKNLTYDVLKNECVKCINKGNNACANPQDFTITKEHCYQFEEKNKIKSKTNPAQKSTPYITNKEEEKYCKYIIDKIKDDIEEELDFLLSERENHIGGLPKDMLIKIVDLRNMLMVLGKTFNFVGYLVDVKKYINELDIKIKELVGK